MGKLKDDLNEIENMDLKPMKKSPVERGVMKQLFEEEVTRLNETRNILVSQGHHDMAQKIYQQLIGVQTFWKILRDKRLAS